MGDPLNQTMDKPCEICGDIGYVAAIIICSKCTVTREHMYCMSIIYEGDRENWICDECDVSNKKPSSKPATSKQSSGTGLQFSLKKPPQNTKVQYITPEEVGSLESGATRNSFSLPSKSVFAQRPSVSKTFMSKMKANPTSSAMHSNICIKPNPQVGSSGHRDSLSKRVMSTSSRDKKLSTSTEKEISVLHCQQSPVAKKQSSARVIPMSNIIRKETNGPARQHHGESPPVKRVTFENSPNPGAKSNNVEREHTPREFVRSSLAAANSEKGAQLCSDTPTIESLPMEKLSKGDNNTVHPPQCVQSFPAASLGMDVYAGAQPKIKDSKERESPRVTLVLDSYLPNHPAKSPTWRGTLKVMNDVLPCSSFDEIQAHPPCKVESRAYKFSMQLPKTLQYELLPRRNTWVDLFKDYVPGELDISLYFFHSTFANLSGDYCSLLDCLDVRDLLLRTCVEGVELFVFSSKHLPENSRMINQRHFLWGLFRPFPRQAQQSMSDNLEAENMGMDMDIDMVGGHEVGKVDIIVSKREDYVCGDHRESEKASSTETKASPVSTAGSVVGFPSVKIEKEWTDDIGKPFACTTSSAIAEIEFDKELQSCFDKFTALMELKDASYLKTDIKKEVNA